MRSSPACRPTPAAPQPAPRAREGSRGTTLSPARPAHTPGTGSSDKPLPDPVTTLRPPSAARRLAPPMAGAQLAIPRSLPPRRRRRAGPGGAPAAQRERTTWGRGKTTAALGREEGQGQKIADRATAPGGHLTPREKDRWKSLTQRGFLSGQQPCCRSLPQGSRCGRYELPRDGQNTCPKCSVPGCARGDVGLTGPRRARGKLSLSAEAGLSGHLAAAVRGICP